MAVRVAIGAGRGRIVRQLLTESMLLATAGAVVGFFAAYAFVRLLLRIGASQLPRLEAVSFDGRSCCSRWPLSSSAGCSSDLRRLCVWQGPTSSR